MTMIQKMMLRTVLLTIAMQGAGCTTAMKARDKAWIDLFTPTKTTSVATGVRQYDADDLARDYDVIKGLRREMRSLSAEMSQRRRTLVFRETPYISAAENKQVEHMLFRFINARDSLLSLLHYYRNTEAASPDLHTKGGVLGMSAGLNLSHYSSRFVALFHGDKELVQLLNTPHHRSDIPAGIYDLVLKNQTSLDNLDLLDVGWYLFSQELASPESPLSTLWSSDARYAELLNEMDDLHANTHIQIEYVLHARAASLPGLNNRLRQSHVARLLEGANSEIQRGLYQARGVLFRDVSRIKNPRSKLLKFSESQMQAITSRLQPGDIILTYTAGFMSNVFLPGNFKHGITYIGSLAQRRAVGLTDEALRNDSVSTEQGDQLIELIHRTKTPKGYAVDVIEAVAEGVVMHSLEEILETHINRMVVLRPRISDEERLQQLLGQFRYVGNGYDFKFDFQDDTYQCCTELIYRTLQDLGTIQLPLIKTRGLWVLAADNIVNYVLEENPDAFDVILFADQLPDSKDFNATVKIGADAHAALKKVMQSSE
jgi:hypothetical protein